jgi:hypothetical protein
MYQLLDTTHHLDRIIGTSMWVPDASSLLFINFILYASIIFHWGHKIVHYITLCGSPQYELDIPNQCRKEIKDVEYGFL